MQTAGNLVRAAAELSAGVQRGEHDFQSGDLLDGMNIGRNAAAVIQHSDALIFMDCYFNPVTETGQSFVDRIVYNFINEVVKRFAVCSANVHSRALADGFHAFQHLNIRCVVFCITFFSGCHIRIVPLVINSSLAMIHF